MTHTPKQVTDNAWQRHGIGSGTALVRSGLPEQAHAPLAIRPDYLWLAVHLPYLPLEALGHNHTERILAVYAQHDQTQQVVAASCSARQAGVQPGMALAVAHSLIPMLESSPRDIAAEKIHLAQLATQAGNWTPAVTVLEDCLLLNIAGSLRLYGGVRALLKQIQHWITAHAEEPCIALTPTPASAALCARVGKALCVTSQDQLTAAVRTLPAQMLASNLQQRRLLGQLGTRQIGDLLRLPRDGLARRLGPGFLDSLDKLLGNKPDPQPTFTPPAAFVQGITLPAESVETAFLFPFMRQLLNQLAAYLRTHCLLAGHLSWDLAGATELLLNVPVQLAQPRCDPERLLALSRLAFENLRPSAPVTRLTLHARHFLPANEVSQELFPNTRKSPSDGEALVEYLQNRLGRQVVQGIRMYPDHRPEKAWGQCVPGETGPLLARATRPLWLLNTPQRLNSCRRSPQLAGQPLQLERQRERICSGWWDDQPIQRDYYWGTTSTVKAWVFRDLTSGHWYLHGIF